MVVLEDAGQCSQAAKVVQAVKGVKKVACGEDGKCTVTAEVGKAEAIAGALKEAGIKASVSVK